MVHALAARAATLRLPPTVRDELLADAVLREHHFYLGLAGYIAPAFAPVPAERVEAISVSGYLYFRFLLGVDRLMDEGPGDRRRMFGHLAMHEGAVRGLTSLFPDGDPFWDAFDACKREYAAAHVRERALSQARGAVTRVVFEEMAAGKSAVCYAMVHALSRLSGSSDAVAAVQECLRTVHVAFQYMDDVEDFRQDEQRGDWTYAHACAAARLSELGVDGTTLTARQRHQRFYTTGVADELLAAAANHLERGRDLASRLGLGELAAYVASQAARVQGYRDEAALLAAKAAVRASKSVTPKEVRAGVVGGPSPRDAAEQAVRHGVLHLRRSRDTDGAWSDFVTSAGHGRLWVTGYVGLHLAESERGERMVRGALAAVASSSEAYNATMQQDGDSTTFLLACRRQATGRVDADALSRWLAFMRPDGGWVTYREPAELRRRLDMDATADVSGWLGPKACVSAAAAYALGGFPELSDAYHRTCGYLLATRRADGSWPSYWWTSPVYATAFALLAFSRDARHAAAGDATAAWLVGQQRADGAWGEGSALYTALATRALVRHGARRATDPGVSAATARAVARAVAWLSAAQTTDGSWQTTRVLRVPPADVEDADDVRRWRQSSFGVRALVDDHNRAFTTSTAVAALHDFAASTASTSEGSVSSSAAGCVA